MTKDADDEEEANFKFDLTEKGYEVFAVQFMAYEAQKTSLCIRLQILVMT